MSAVAGIWRFESRPNPGDVDAMLAQLAHRGPDGLGVWHGEEIALGHRTLRTVPETPAETLPLHDAQSSLTVTADARIDNRDELSSALGLSRRQNPISDAHLILAAYRKWGEDCPGEIIGDFAFAIWDQRERRLFCARDIMGVRPFFYFQCPRMFAFASEIKALLLLAEAPRALNHDAAASFARGVFDDPSVTFYRGIRRLPEAATLTVRPKTCSTRRYWSLDPSREIRLPSDREYAEAFGALFREAVRCRARTVGSLGSALSGGLDSSSITCIARNLLIEQGRAPLRTFSIVFPALSETFGRRIDERPYITAVVALGAIEPCLVEADRLNPLRNLDAALSCGDQPFFAPNLYLHEAMYRCALQSGVRVFLDGFDGDSAVSLGLERLSELAFRGCWLTLLRECRLLSVQAGRGWTTARVGWSFGVRPILAAIAGGAVPWLQPGFPARYFHHRALTSRLLPYALEIADKSAAACSVEPRYPFLDRRLLEFCLAIPSDQKLSRGWTRVVHRRAMEGELPREVQWRFSKGDLSPNFRRALLCRNFDVLRQSLIRNPGPLGKFVDLARLRKPMRQILDQRQDYLSVYRAVILGRWLQLTRFDL